MWLKLSGPMRNSDEDFPYAGMTPFAKILARHACVLGAWILVRALRRDGGATELSIPALIVLARTPALGSDWPHVQMNGRLMPNDGDLVDLLAEWVPETTTQQRIVTQNPLALYR